MVIDHHKYLNFTVNSVAFLIAVDCIESIIDSPVITKIPNAASDIAGLLNFSGRIITVIDMGGVLKTKPVFNNSQKFFVIVVEFADELYGLLVNSVAEIFELKEINNDKTFENLEESIKSISNGVYQAQDKFYIIVTIDKIINQFL